MSDKKKRSMVGLPWIVAMTFFMQALDAITLNIASSAIAHNLDRSLLAVQSVTISYALTVAMLTPVSGWLADCFGTRRIFTLAVSLFTLGSLAYVLSNSLPQLVVFRVIQGIGGVMMMPIARLTLLRVYPHNELLPVLNFVTMPGLMGPILGPVPGGVLVTWATWHWIFLISTPIGIVGLLYVHKHMPNFIIARRRFDITGFLLFDPSPILSLSGIELFGEKIVASWIALTATVASIGLLLLYIFHARCMLNPLISLDLFRTRTFSIGIVSNITTRLRTSCVSFLMSSMLQVGLEYQAFIAGCMMVPIALGSIVVKSMATQVLRHLDYRHTLAGITVIIGLMIVQFSLQPPVMAIWILISPLFALGMVMSTQLTAMNTIIPADLIDDNASSSNSVLAVTQQLSISSGVAVSAAILRVRERMEGTMTVEQFHYTFITMGIITVALAAMLMLLKTAGGNNLIKRQRKSKPNHALSEPE